MTNAQWQGFVEAGGYDRRDLWSDRGWEHRHQVGLERPWRGGATGRGCGSVWSSRSPPTNPSSTSATSRRRPSPAGPAPDCRTELEWEKACAWDPGAGRRRRWPWGSAAPSPELANLGGGALRPAPVGSLPAGASAYGVEQLIGDVWEWTSSGFEAWPGFSPMLYAQYSAPFFGGDYRVLRGGSWATAASTVRPSFRNWDHPFRRQIFTGLRLAWDV